MFKKFSTSSFCLLIAFDGWKILYFSVPQWVSKTKKNWRLELVFTPACSILCARYVKRSAYGVSTHNTQEQPSDIELNTNFQFSTINWLFKQSNTKRGLNDDEKYDFFLLYKNDSFVDSILWLNSKFVARLQCARRRRTTTETKKKCRRWWSRVWWKFYHQKFPHAHSIFVLRGMLMKLQFSKESPTRKIKELSKAQERRATQCLRRFSFDLRRETWNSDFLTHSTQHNIMLLLFSQNV